MGERMRGRGEEETGDESSESWEGWELLGAGKDGAAD